MAGGIDWFRWHHGTVNDQKFPLVARKSGASVAEVIAVWACLLERASQAEERGTVGEPDFEAMDCALGMSDGKAQAIFSALQARDLVDDSHSLTAWSVRQPKKEDESAADRKRAQREREAAEREQAERDAAAKSVTQRDEHACHAMSRDVTLEKRREEENSSSLRSEEGTRKRAASIPAPDDVDAQVWADWLALRKAKKAPVTETVVDGARREAAKADLSFESFLRIWCQRGSQGLQADWLKPHERAGPSRAPTAAEQRVLQAVPGLAAPHLRQPPPTTLFVEEVGHEPSLTLG